MFNLYSLSGSQLKPLHKPIISNNSNWRVLKSEDESGDQNVTNGPSNDKKLSVQLKNNNISGLAEGMKLFDRICKDLQSKTITIFLIDYQKYQ